MPGQQRFRLSDALYRGFCGGRGAGKTFVGAFDLIDRALATKGYYLIASPTYGLMDDITIPEFQKVCREFVGAFYRISGKPRPNARLSNGSVIRFRSAEEPDKLRGPNLSGTWLDEASLMDKEAYDIVIACLREKGRQGWLSATFTPKGLLHWTYDAFGSGKPNSASFHAKTRHNLFLPPGFHDQLAEQYDGLWAQQELEGAFVNLGDVEFPATYFDWDGFWFDEWPADIQMKVLNLDPSKGVRERNDFAAFVVLGIDSKGGLWVDAEILRAPAETLAGIGVRLCQEHRPIAFGIESVMMQELFLPLFRVIAAKQGIVLPLYGQMSKTKKDVRIRKLGPRLARRELHFRRSKGGKMLVEQLKAFPQANDPKSGVHDDGPDATEAAIRLLRWMLVGRRSLDQGEQAPQAWGG
jgi:hypothetical protein